MKRFAALYRAMDATTSTQRKVDALVEYFRVTPSRDAAWAAWFLAGGKPRQVMPRNVLKDLACEVAGVAPWLFDECYSVAGDLAEAIAYVLPPPVEVSDEGLADWVQNRILTLRGRERDAQCAAIREAWARLTSDERFLHAKLIGGGFRVGASRLLVQRSLALAFGLDPKRVAQRLVGYTDARRPPDTARFEAIIATGEAASAEPGLPYPFFLAHPLAVAGEEASLQAALGDPPDWLVEWKFDGIRAQIVVRDGKVWIWTRGEELVTERFPEVASLARALPQGTVLDGEILAWLPQAEKPADFALLQRRIGRLALTKKVLAEAPVSFVAYDLLESRGLDLRGEPQHARRLQLEQVLAGTAIRLSPSVHGDSWSAFAIERGSSRARGVEGFMLKHRDSRYGIGRTRADGIWWKWKIDALRIDGLLIYAQAGHGRRANLYTDYTFAVWNRLPTSADEAASVFDAIARRAPIDPGGLHLVPFAKAYSGLTDEEFRRVDSLVRKTTVEKFGPVRSLRPSLVFELGFEGVARSARHKSGIATRFPRMLRIRDDKPPHEADTLQALEAMIDAPG